MSFEWVGTEFIPGGGMDNGGGVPAPTTTGTDHGSLAGLSDDDHTIYVHVSTARTITTQHTFNPAGAPFLIGAAATGALVAGLNADQVDGREETAFALLAGRAGAQTLTGGTASGEDLGFVSTAHATKGKVKFGNFTAWVNHSGDLIVDSNSRGLVMKDDAGTPHYWRLTVSSLGVLATTDLGTSPP